MKVAVLKYMLKEIRLADRYLARKKAKRISDHKNKKGLLRLTLAIFIFFVGTCLIATLTISDEKGLSQQQTSSVVGLKHYADKNDNALSLAVMDQPARNQVFARRAEKKVNFTNVQPSEVVLSSGPPCPTKDDCSSGPGPIQPTPPPSGFPRSQPSPTPSAGEVSCDAAVRQEHSITRAKLSGFAKYIPGCNDTGDFLTAGDGSDYHGALFSIPLTLTTQNQAVVKLVGVMQGGALVLITPIVALIGISYMTGRGTWRFADLLEALPRLLLSVIGIVTCLLVSEQIIDFGYALTSGFMQSLHVIDPHLPSVTDYIMPSSQWQTWLTIMSLLAGLTIGAIVIAPLNVFLIIPVGAPIAATTMAGVMAGTIADTPRFVETALSMTIAGQVIVRIILIDVYIVLSPMAMLAAGLPGQDGVSFTREWITGFLNLIASHFVVVVAFGVGLEVSSAFADAANHSGIVSLMIKYATLALMIRVPGLFRSNAVSLVMQAGSTASSIVQKERSPLASW